MDISVICPVYNTEPSLLRQAIESVLLQDGDHQLEVIIVDDCSSRTDTIEMLKNLASNAPHVTLSRQEINGGPSRARSEGVKLARSKWIGFIDADDIWPEKRLERAEFVLLESPDARWIGGNYATLRLDGKIYTNDHISKKIRSDRNGIRSCRLKAPELTRTLVQDWLPLGTSLIRKDLIEEVGGFNSSLHYGEDWLLFLKISAVAPMDYIEAETYILRRQRQSMMWSSRRMSRELLKAGYVAKRDPSLIGIRRELRWNYYSFCRDIAMNNALNGNKLRGLIYAIRALVVDPREVGNFLTFVRAMNASNSDMAIKLKKYSSAEQIILSKIN